MSVTYSVCVFVTLVIQLADGMRHIIICSLSRCSKIITLSQERQDFRGEKLLKSKFEFFYFLNKFV